MIELSGLVPDDDIEIKYTGLKEGEKFTEILSSTQEQLSPTGHEKLLLVHNTEIGNTDIEQIDELISKVRSFDSDQVRQGIREIVIDYSPDAGR